MWMPRLAALFCGIVSVAAFEPFGLWWLLLLTLGCLFHLWTRSAATESAVLGYCFGLGLFGAGVSWIYVSLKVYGNMPAPMAAAAVVLFVAALSLYPAATGYIQAKISVRPSVRLLVLIPALWVLAEALRSLLLSGFPWLLIGYSQTDGPLAGFAPLGGVLLASLSLAICSASLALLAHDKKRIILVAPTIVALLLLSWSGTQYEWTTPEPEPVLTATVQGNVSLSRKWNRDYRAQTLQNYLRLSDQSQAELVVWPETAAAYYVHEIDDATWQRLSRNGRTVVFGALETITDNGQQYYYNSAILSCGGDRRIYRKQHLVPFGEFLPFADWLGWVLNYLQIPMSDFSAWPNAQDLQCPPLKLAVSICYEDAFEDEFRQSTQNKHILVNLSEDAWFGDSLAPHQRLQMAQMRVLENAKPMVRAGNTGPSAIIDYDGNILAKSAQFEPAVLEARIFPRSGSTWFARTGNTPLLILLVIIVAALPAFKICRKQR